MIGLETAGMTTLSRGASMGPGMGADSRLAALGTRAGATADRSARSFSIQDFQAEFSSVLARETGRKPAGPEAAREAAADFVAAALVEPVLKELRSNAHAAAPFAPGPGEKQFRGLLDAQIARRITRAAHFPLVDHLAQVLLNRSTEPAGASRAPESGPARVHGGAS